MPSKNNNGKNKNIKRNTICKHSALEDALFIQPKALQNKHISLKERLKNFNENFEIEKWDDGELVGREIINA